MGLHGAAWERLHSLHEVWPNPGGGAVLKCSDQSDALASNTVGNIPPPLPTQITRTLCPSTPYMLSCPPCSPHQAPRPAFLESPLLNAFRQTGGRGGQGDGLQHEEKVGDDDTHTPSTTVTTAGDAGQIVLPVFNFGIRKKERKIYAQKIHPLECSARDRRAPQTNPAVRHPRDVGTQQMSVLAVSNSCTAVLLRLEFIP